MKSFKDHLEEGGLWDNIHAKRKRIKGGSKERMRKPGSKGAPTSQDFKDSQNEEKEKGVDGKACWKGYKRMGTKKKGGKTVDNCVPMEDVASVQPMSGPTGSMFAMKKEGKEHSWKSEGHYTKDGKEWTGPQHAHDGQVMTGEKHTADSQDLYHYKALPADVRKKVAKTIEEKLLARKNSIGDYIKDFKKSDAPQFKGRGESKRKQMAVAAYLKSKRRDGERALGEDIKYDSNMGR